MWHEPAQSGPDRPSWPAATPSAPEAARERLVDTFGRAHTSLRVSVTDRCNLRCVYCLPRRGVPVVPIGSVLSDAEITRAVQCATDLGVRRVRITGGEPLLRSDLPRLIARLAALPGLDDLALTTNGLLLEQVAPALAAAGLRRLNVSLDGLDAETFTAMTRGGGLDRVWAGVHTAARAGLTPIRLNVVVLAGVNDQELDRWVQLTEDEDVTVRFLELMPIGEGARLWASGHYHDLSAARRDLARRFLLEPATEPVGNGPARYWRVRGGRGRIGFITPLSDPYCDRCSRLRLSATGSLRACLAFDDAVDLLPALRGGDDEALRAGFREAVAGKRAGHAWRTGQITRASMSGLGG